MTELNKAARIKKLRRERATLLAIIRLPLDDHCFPADQDDEDRRNLRRIEAELAKLEAEG